MTELEKLIAREELKTLVDNYATESDRNNQDYYVNVFTEDCHVRVYFNNELGMDLTNVQADKRYMHSSDTSKAIKTAQILM
jgi:hypothetical protein